jgi:cellulose synthase/poly-beta-1,6-N-acetylglucosamine synthase-like glycosyltransferase
MGRNFGVKKAEGDVILFTDAGCLLDKDWVSEITKPFTDKKTEVVAGYYKGEAKNAFQKALIPFVLVMKDKIDRKNFLPATRSMAIRKDTFVSLGGFEEKYSHNEDYVFANKIKNSGVKMGFARKAIAMWLPRNTLGSTFRMFYRFAVGDMEAGIVRGKVLLLFARYLLLSYLLVLSYLYKSLFILSIVSVSVVAYLIWSYKKHQRYLEKRREYFYTVLIQLVCDVSVMSGSLIGSIKYLSLHALDFAKSNKIASIVIFIYISMMVSIIGWGLPSPSHPFVYHMDEWHFLNAISSVATIGDPNVDGSAHTAMFYPFLSGIFLAPFILFKIINPFVVNSPFEQYQMQERIFEVLRIHTILSGIIALVAVGFISKYFVKIPSFILVVLLCFTPTFISLSGFYKYDITLLS